MIPFVLRTLERDGQATIRWGKPGQLRWRRRSRNNIVRIYGRPEKKIFSLLVKILKSFENQVNNAKLSQKQKYFWWRRESGLSAGIRCRASPKIWRSLSPKSGFTCYLLFVPRRKIGQLLFQGEGKGRRPTECGEGGGGYREGFAAGLERERGYLWTSSGNCYWYAAWNEENYFQNKNLSNSIKKPVHFLQKKYLRQNFWEVGILLYFLCSKDRIKDAYRQNPKT